MRAIRSGGLAVGFAVMAVGLWVAGGRVHSPHVEFMGLPSVDPAAIAALLGSVAAALLAAARAIESLATILRQLQAARVSPTPAPDWCPAPPVGPANYERCPACGILRLSDRPCHRCGV
jgi:hypothetical protein